MFDNPNAQRDAILLKWQDAQKALEAAKEAEAEARLAALQVGFSFDKDADTDREGTENLELGGGWMLKAVFKLNRNLGAKDKVEKILTKIENSGPEGAFIAERLVSWKPNLSISEYKKLSNPLRKLIDEVVTTSVATPSLELIPPKGK